jgi:hypothetical protein
MAQYGLGNFVYELEISNDTANFSFHDPNDVTNTAEVSVSKKDFPEGIVQPDSRQVADLAYAQCSKVLNDKRDARLKKEASAEFNTRTDEEARSREAQADFLNNAQDASVQPAKTEDDGTKVYNTAEASDSSSSSNSSTSSSKK